MTSRFTGRNPIRILQNSENEITFADKICCNNAKRWRHGKSMMTIQIWRGENMMLALFLCLLLSLQIEMKLWENILSLPVAAFQPNNSPIETYTKANHVGSTYSYDAKSNRIGRRKEIGFFPHLSLSSEDAFDLERYQRRRERHNIVTSACSDNKYGDTTSLPPKEVVTSVLEALRSAPYYYDFDPYKPNKQHPGVSVLWHCSSGSLRRTLATMVGGSIDQPDNSSKNRFNDQIDTKSVVVVSTNSDDIESNSGNRYDSNSLSTNDGLNRNNVMSEEQIIPALGRLLSRRKRQFAILIGVENGDYYIDFPTDVVEYADDEVWFETRLRDKNDDSLLVVLGWTMARIQKKNQPYKDSDNNYNDKNFNNNEDTSYSWYIHAIDWQDFRDEYRPGEEWERICG